MGGEVSTGTGSRSRERGLEAQARSVCRDGWGGWEGGSVWSIHDMAPMGRVPKVTRVCGVDMGKMLNYNKVKTAVDMHCFHTHTHTSHKSLNTHRQTELF